MIDVDKVLKWEIHEYEKMFLVYPSAVFNDQQQIIRHYFDPSVDDVVDLRFPTEEESKKKIEEMTVPRNDSGAGSLDRLIAKYTKEPNSDE